MFAKKLLKEVVYRVAPHRLRLPTYPYMVHPAGLAFLCSCLEETHHVPGAVVEIGCAWGCTTLFLNEQLDWQKSDKPYLTIDTFSGFPAEHTEYEATARGKDRAFLDRQFRSTGVTETWFRRAMANAGAARVRTIRSDISRYRFDPDLRISFCFIDVDLYLSVRDALEKVFPLMSPGGIIAVHDCRGVPWSDGAGEAYEQFVKRHGLPFTLAADVFGVVRA
ncbi:MAG TPA: TylF/MycF/NovP-related O-methyltransferase [Gemmatimonadales bacterium]|nr:TylF/MycF/NovP-related O-methyltransferase [Gemmatimonadales bacterium]